LAYLTGSKESEEILAKFMSNVFLRSDVLDNLTSLLIKSTQQALEDEKAHEVFVNFLLRIVYNQKLKEGILENLLYSPVRSFFTFGYGGAPNQVQL
jgi:hypothetical protein